MKKLLLLLLIIYSVLNTAFSQFIQTDVLIIGGGASGVSAGIQSARLGAKTLIVEETPWLGGVLTSAGVSAINGNNDLPSGLWSEFRDSLKNRYGGNLALKSGWASNTMFEPSVGADIFKNMVAKESYLRLLMETKFLNLKRINPSKDVIPNIQGGWSVQVKDKKGKAITIEARILIDATDLGDVTKAAGIRYKIGTDDPRETGEEDYAVSKTNIVQDMTYVAIMKDYGSDAPAIAKPQGYNPSVFDCSCGKKCGDEKVVGCNKMIDFGKLPNDKYIINWHISGNHFNANIIDADEKTRKKAYDDAKKQTMCFLYYIQQELGYKNLGLSDEYPTADKLPFTIYHRESRLTEGVATLSLNHILKPFDQIEPLYKTGIAVSDLPLSHHHASFKGTFPNIYYPKTPSFSVPLGSLIPKDAEDFIVAEKGISVTNIVNGSTQTQSCLMLIGQAAGVLAATCAKENISIKKVSVRKIQSILLENKAYLMPYCDVKPNHPFFDAIQRVGATGILRGRGDAGLTTSKTWFDPDSMVTMRTFYEAFAPFTNDAAPSLSPAIPETLSNTPDLLKTTEIIEMLWSLAKVMDIELENYENINDFKKTIKYDWTTLKLGSFDPNKPIKRAELAILVDFYLNPFYKKEVDKNGHLR